MRGIKDKKKFSLYIKKPNFNKRIKDFKHRLLQILNWFLSQFVNTTKVSAKLFEELYYKFRKFIVYQRHYK